MTSTIISLENQREMLDKHMEAAVAVLRGFTDDYKFLEILKTSIDSRFTDGFRLFGDSVWYRTPEHLTEEALEEIADALIYLSVAIKIGKDEKLLDMSSGDKPQDADTRDSHQEL